MPSGDEPDSGDIVSERETQFVERSDDDETLWEVEEITAERKKQYKVKWVGTDPATGKPWAQSWVPKHDCTNALVAKWKAKKAALPARKRGGRMTSTASRTSGSSRRTGSSSPKRNTRTPMSEATSSRVESVGRDPPPSPPKKTGTKRRRQSETPLTATSGAADGVDEGGEVARPVKKQRMAAEVLVPSMPSNGIGGARRAAKTRVKVTARNNVPSTSRGATLHDSEEEDNSPPRPKGKGKAVSRLRLRSKIAAGSSKMASTREEPKRSDYKGKSKAVPTHNEHVVDAITISDDSDDDLLRPPDHKSKVSSKRKSTPEQDDNLSEEGAGSAGTPAPIKVGPPRGAKRNQVPKKSGSSRKPSAKRVEVDSTVERAPTVAGGLMSEAPSFDTPNTPPLLQDTIEIPFPPPIHIPSPPPNPRHRSPELSPGAIERLKLFDQMMADPPELDVAPPVERSEGREAQPYPALNDLCQLDDAHHDIHEGFDAPEPPHPLSPPPSKPKLKHTKPGTPNGLVVPETESSGNSQSQSQSPPKPPPLPPLPPARDQLPCEVDLPTIAVIAASASSSSASPQDLIPPPQRFPIFAGRTLKRPLKPVPLISPNTFRSKIGAPSRTFDTEVPPSSIESFASPKRVDKGKQRAVVDDRLQSSLSEDEGKGNRLKEKITDSGLKKRGKELFNRAQLARKAKRQKGKKAKLPKNVNDIVHGMVSSPPKGSPFSTTKNLLGMQWEEVIDLTGGMNSTTLDTTGQSETRPMSEEERNRLRIELRQEEEESTQEAMFIYPPLPMEKSRVMVAESVEIPAPGPSKHTLSNGEIADVDHLEQPSTDLQQASLIVQASQEPRHEDTDMDPSPSNPHTSSPPRPIPGNLTDSPKRRLGEALSLLNVKSEEIQRLEHELSEERKKLQGLKAELAVVRQASESAGPVLATREAERARWAEERYKWENESSAWQTQREQMSEERTKLLARVAELSDAAARAEEVRAKLSGLEVERVAWTKERDDLLSATAQRPEELTVLAQVRGEHGQDRLKWEAEKASWLEEKAGWQSERTALQEKQESLSRSVEELSTAVESQRSATASAQKDRDFFREQYAQASAFVGSVRDENVELEKRVKIAEGQAQEGVAAIKAFYEGRATALQDDVTRWKGLTELLQEKDRRTNDEVRLRAAQVPELVELCGGLTAENKSLEAEIWKLARAQQRSVAQRKDLCHKILLLQNERKSLRSKLSRLVKAAASDSQGTSQPAPAPPILDDSDIIGPNDMETVPDPTPLLSDPSFDELAFFPCMWRPQWRDQCQHVFDTKEDLERHLQEHFRDLLTQ